MRKVEGEVAKVWREVVNLLSWVRIESVRGGALLIVVELGQKDELGGRGVDIELVNYKKAQYAARIRIISP